MTELRHLMHGLATPPAVHPRRSALLKALKLAQPQQAAPVLPAAPALPQVRPESPGAALLKGRGL